MQREYETRRQKAIFGTRRQSAFDFEFSTCTKNERFKRFSLRKPFNRETRTKRQTLKFILKLKITLPNAELNGAICI